MGYAIYLVRTETRTRQQQSGDPYLFEREEDLEPFTAEQHAQLKARLARYGFTENGQAGTGLEFDNPSSELSALMTERGLYLRAAHKSASIFNASIMAAELTDNGEFAAWDPQAGAWNPQEENTSGQGKQAAVPAEIRGWNWGAFLLNGIWGLGNTTYVALLVLIPFFGIAMPFVLGAKGNEWAWQNQRWTSVAHFKATQRKWARWGVGLWLVFGLAVAGLFVGITSALKDSEPYRHASALLKRDLRVAARYGFPLSTGLPSGSFKISGPDGTASMQFSVEGFMGEGTAYVEARRRLGRWEIEQLVVENEDSGVRIDVR